jgi:SHS2 domain-containing protein
MADIAFRADGRNLEELFMSSWEAALRVLVENPEILHPRQNKSIEIDEVKIDLLLFEFLEQLIFYKDAESILLQVDTLKIEEDAKVHRLSGTLAGEVIDPERHELGVDVKAITFHGFEVKRTGEIWEALVVLDT